MRTTRALFTIAIFFALFSSLDLNAQVILGLKKYSHDTRLDVGLSVGMPTNYVFKSVIDADIRFQRDLSPSLAGLLNIGFTYFLESDVPALSEFKGNTGFIPVKTGVKLFLTEKLYASGEIGAALQASIPSSVSFIYSPAIGFEVNEGLDIGLRYESLTRFDVAKIALKVSCGLRLKREKKFMYWYQ